jgi:hypothetical protein
MSQQEIVDAVLVVVGRKVDRTRQTTVLTLSAAQYRIDRMT